MRPTTKPDDEAFGPAESRLGTGQRWAAWSPLVQVEAPPLEEEAKSRMVTPPSTKVMKSCAAPLSLRRQHA